MHIHKLKERQKHYQKYDKNLTNIYARFILDLWLQN